MTYKIVKYEGADAGTVAGVFTSLGEAWAALSSGYIIEVVYTTEKSK